MPSLDLSKLVTWLYSAFVNSFYYLYNSVLPKNKLTVPSPRIREVVTKTDAVCFDVDSTVLNHEAIVSLAEACGAQEQIAELTHTAMSGKMTFQDSLRLRLNIMKPSKTQMLQLRTKYSQTIDQILTPGIRELIELLHSKGVTVYLISGGFKELIEPVADAMGIPRENVHANVLFFNAEGEYEGFDETQYTSASGGKRRAVTAIKQHHERAIMIGDGMTDFEAYPPADLFIGFGGNVERQEVKKVAPWYIYSFQEIIDVLKQ